MPSTSWGIDLGTTNTGVAGWDADRGQPQLVELPAVCRSPGGNNPLQAPRMVPTVVQLLERDRLRLLDRLGAWPPVVALAFLGRVAEIGRPALERNQGIAHASYVPGFKQALMTEPVRPLATCDGRAVTARDAAAAFLRQLLAEVTAATGRRPRDLVVTAPVVAFETYRAEVQAILRRLGVGRVRFVDEPVAAALGYGLSLVRERTLLVVDIGGGTMHVVLVRLTPRGATGGQAEVLAKQGSRLGGDAVDGWVLDEMCREMGQPLDRDDDEESVLWRRLLLAEACRVKEAVFFQPSAEFLVVPPQALVAATGARAAAGNGVELTRARLTEVLTANGFFKALDQCVSLVLAEAQLGTEGVEEVLLVGGSTLLPGVFALVEGRFGRSRLRAWQPFEAVALGAACFAADRVSALDFIVNDYAFLTHDAKTGAEQHTVIVPRGTRFPTPPDFWRRQLVPTCALGEPETIFKLLVCEIGRGDGGVHRLVFDAAGDVHKVGGDTAAEEIVVPLNAASPTLGTLDPPHSPRDHRPRLDVAFGVNADRWLVATVRDLLAGKELMHEEPVVRLV
ncbi:MAG TPA: Hsp70 family protein [Thermoanaerobaculia bacterium]|jgi:molecular chaperone DnaK (HSP70)|nr:Hsp70 family protein [Thermoanaerobaculia bacterium]